MLTPQEPIQFIQNYSRKEMKNVGAIEGLIQPSIRREINTLHRARTKETVAPTNSYLLFYGW